MQSHHRLHPRIQRGFTLVELLVVIAIIGVLVAMLLPAVNGARESSRRTQCMNQMRQIALASINYESSHRSFQPGVPSCSRTASLWVQGGSQAGAYCQGPNWLVSVLSFMEEASRGDHAVEAMQSFVRNAADDLEHYGCDVDGYSEHDNLVRTDNDAKNIGRIPLEAFLCPSAPVMSMTNRIDTYSHDSYIAKGNYAANWGPNNYMAWQSKDTHGAFGVTHLAKNEEVTQVENDPTMVGGFKMGFGQGSQTAHFRDGLSKTMMLSEVIGFDDPTDGRGGWTLNAMGSSIFTAKNGPNSIDLSGTSEFEGDTIPMCGRRAVRAPNSPLPCRQNRSNGDVWASARSKHLGGVNVAFCDASMKFVTDDVDLAVWRGLSTRAGGETVGYE